MSLLFLPGVTQFSPRCEIARMKAQHSDSVIDPFCYQCNGIAQILFSVSDHSLALMVGLQRRIIVKYRYKTQYAQDIEAAEGAGRTRFQSKFHRDETIKIHKIHTCLIFHSYHRICGAGLNAPEVSFVSLLMIRPRGF